MNARKMAVSGAALATAATLVSATPMMDVPCEIIRSVARALAAIGPTIVAIMFVYGGVKYTYSSDDPGGRKQGKTMMIHAVIGAIIMGLVVAIIALTGAGGSMCGVDTIFS